MIEKYKEFILLSMILVVFSKCKEQEKFLTGMQGFNVYIDGDIGSPEKQLPFTDSAKEFSIIIRAYGFDGSEKIEPWTDFSGWVRISTQPGTLTLAIDQKGPEKNTIFIKDGVSDTLKISLMNVFGNTLIWVGSLGYSWTPEGEVSSCSNQDDDDGDGVVDFPFDLGCATADDNSEIEDDLYNGISPIIYIKNPSISDIQHKQKASPFAGSYVTVTEGNMIVTHITTEGFYLTDLNETEGYNHIYVFTFNTPENLMVCDRILKLSGIIQEFYGFTEMSTPSWLIEEWDESKGKCPVPVPINLTVSEVGDNAIMEAFESALVQVKDAKLSSKFTNCDYNGDGYVDWRNYDTNECSDECKCGESCKKDVLCTELTQYNQYGQFGIAVSDDTTSKKINVITKGSPVDFDPIQYNGKDLTIKNLVGTLRNVSFLKPQWIIEPRCNDDFVLEGEYKGSDKACIMPKIIKDDVGM